MRARIGSLFRARRYASAVAAQEGLLLQTGLYSVRMTLNDSNVSLDVQLYLSRNANARAGRGSGAEARMIDDDHLRGFTYSDSRAGRSESRRRRPPTTSPTVTRPRRLQHVTAAYRMRTARIAAVKQ